MDKMASVRGYFLDTMAVTKCHEDVQICGGEENYTLYTTKYADKFSDQMRKVSRGSKPCITLENYKKHSSFHE